MAGHLAQRPHRVPTGLSAVIFDMDGLLVDSEPLYLRAWQEAAAGLGFDLTVELYGSFLGRPEAECEADLMAVFGPAFPLGEFRERWKERWVQLVEAGELLPKPGAAALLRALERSNVPVALATSSTSDYASLSLERTGLSGFFRHVVTAGDVERGKPAPDLFLLAASRLGVPARECLVLEDAPSGARAGLAAGMSVIVVPDLQEPPDDCAQRVLQVARSLDEATPRILLALGVA